LKGKAFKHVLSTVADAKPHDLRAGSTIEDAFRKIFVLSHDNPTTLLGDAND